LIEQGLTSPPTQYRLYGRRYCAYLELKFWVDDSATGDIAAGRATKLAQKHSGLGKGFYLCQTNPYPQVVQIFYTCDLYCRGIVARADKHGSIQ